MTILIFVVFMPMALESPSVLKSILAWAASHLSGFQVDYEPTALRYGSSALQCLASDLSDKSKHETNLASCLILCAAASPSNQWHSHLEGAKAIIETVVATGPGGKTLRGVEYFAQSQDGQWLLRDFSYHDVLGAVSMGREPLIKGKYWLPQDQHVLDACMGLGSGILGILSEICCLKLDSATTAQYEADSEWPEGSRTGVDYSSWPPFVDIESRLCAWACADGQAEDLVELAESHRLTALVCLYRKMRELFPEDNPNINAEIARLVRDLIQSIEKTSYQSIAEGGLIFPVFIAGGDAPDEDSIAAIRVRMKGLLEHRGFKHIALALDVLEELWRLKQRGVKHPNGLDIDWRDIVDRREIKLMLH